MTLGELKANLSRLDSYFQIPTSGDAHDALADVKTTALLAQKLTRIAPCISETLYEKETP